MLFEPVILGKTNKIISNIVKLGAFTFPTGWTVCAGFVDPPTISFGTTGYIISNTAFSYDGTDYALVWFWYNSFQGITPPQYSLTDIANIDCGLYDAWGFGVTIFYNHGQKAAVDAFFSTLPVVYAEGLFTTLEVKLDSIFTAANIATTVNTMAAKINQIFTYQITSNADAGDVVMATSTDNVIVHGLTIRSNGATTADFTSMAIYASAAKRITMLTDAQGVLANLVNNGNQIIVDYGLSGVMLGNGETIIATMTGTGATAVDISVFINYSAVTNGTLS